MSSILRTLYGLIALHCLATALDRQVEASLALASSVKLHVTSKRSFLHGQAAFDVFANPVVSLDGTSIFYDGYATFEEDGSTFTYFYVNGTGYLTINDESPTCRPSDTLPFDLIIPALNDAVATPRASIGAVPIPCEEGTLLKTKFFDTNFALCAAGDAGFTAYSSDLTIHVDFLDAPVALPPLDGVECDAVATPVVATPTVVALLTGRPLPASTKRHLQAAEPMAIDNATCACKSTPRPCIFFHGIGVEHELSGLQDTPRHATSSSGRRMGNMNDHAPCCTKVKYAVLNTVDAAWTDDALQHKVCDRAVALSDDSAASPRVVTETVIVTHSMAGLVLAMAIATGKCRLGQGATWVAVSTPMKGTMASDYFQSLCDKRVRDLTPRLFARLGQCPLPLSRQSVVYQHGRYASDALKAAYTKAQQAYRDNVDAALCSASPTGVFSEYQAIMTLTAHLVPHNSPENDALVEFQSCAIGLDETKFGTSYKDTFYKAELNHADTAFLTQDGWFKDSQKPKKWFECLL